MKRFYFAIAGLMIFCFSCLSDRPSEQLVLDELNRQKHDDYSVTGIRKTDGQEADLMGIKTYRLFFDADIQCLRGKEDEKPLENSSALQMPNLGGLHNPGQRWVECGKKGKTKAIGVANFEKHESGWVLTGLNFGNQP